MRRRRIATNALATVALVLGLSAGSYGAFDLPKKSIKTGNIVNGQVKRADLGKGAVTGHKVGTAAVTRNKFVLGRLPVGPPGTMGPTGDKGPRGDAGPRGAATARYGIDQPVVIPPSTFQMSVPITPDPSWTQAAGETDLVVAGASLDQLSGTTPCAGGGYLLVEVRVDNYGITFFSPILEGAAAGELGGVTAPDVPTNRTLSVRASNTCTSDSWEIESLDIHVVRAP